MKESDGGSRARKVFPILFGVWVCVCLSWGSAGAGSPLEPESGPPARETLREENGAFQVPAANDSIYGTAPRLYHRKGEDLVRRTGKECRDCHVSRYYPQDDFFGWEFRKKWVVHWGLFSVAVFFMLLGLYSAVSIWTLGRRPSLHRAVHWPSALSAVFRNGVLGERIWRQSRLRWAVFVLVSMAFLMLAGVFGLTLVNRFVLPPGIPFQGGLGLALDLLADFLGGCILAGTLLALYRRIPGRKDSLKTEWEDLVILLLLLGVILTGFSLEACRLAAVAPEPETWASFLGALGGRVLRQVDLPWTVIRFYVWNVHAILVFGLLAYLPYSKLFHLLAAPVTIAATASEAHYRQRL
jgi:nitrate reductase gamma subunit